MTVFIGIDSGTQSVKAVALDLERGRVVAEARAPHRMIAGLPAGHMEQHPEEWAKALDRVLMEVSRKIKSRSVRGIGVSGQQHGFVPLDGNGKVIRPAKLWCDTSTTRECEIMTRKLGGPSAAIRKTGNLILPGFTAPKILWLKRNEPRNFRRLRHVLLPHDYLNFVLTGNTFMEPGDASGTALMDVRRRTWSREATGAVDPHLGDWLPAISASHEAAGTLLPKLAKRYGFPPDVVVSAGGGDNMMGAIGTGNVVPGVVTASFGTSGTIYGFSKAPVVDPDGEIAAFCSSTGGWLPLLCTMNVTTVTERMCALFGFDHAKLDAAVRSTPPGAGGMLLLPYLAGERTPNVPDGSGLLFGIRQPSFTPGNFARAAMEGVTMGMNYGLRRLTELGIKPTEIRVTGGGARSSIWRQLMADIFNVPVVAMAADESAALGAALQAAWCVGLRSDPKTSLPHIVARTVKPDASTRCKPRLAEARRYRDLQAIQDKLSLAVRDVFTAHKKLVGG